MQKAKQFVVYYEIVDDKSDKHETFNWIDDAWASIAKCVENGSDSVLTVRCGKETFSYN